MGEKCTSADGTGLPRADVLEYRLVNGAKLMVRPSGTEPKIKAGRRRRHGVDSAALVAVFYDGAFVLFHGHRVAGGHAAGAGGLAQSGADPAGKLRVADRKSVG